MEKPRNERELTGQKKNLTPHQRKWLQKFNAIREELLEKAIRKRICHLVC